MIFSSEILMPLSQRPQWLKISDVGAILIAQRRISADTWASTETFVLMNSTLHLGPVCKLF